MAKTSNDQQDAPDDAKGGSDQTKTIESKSAGGAVPSDSEKAEPSSDAPQADKAPDDTSNSLAHDAHPRELSLRAFLRICGEPEDQVAGFARHAELNKPGRFTLEDWKDALKTFKSAPVR